MYMRFGIIRGFRNPLDSLECISGEYKGINAHLLHHSAGISQSYFLLSSNFFFISKGGMCIESCHEEQGKKTHRKGENICKLYVYSGSEYGTERVIINQL